MYIAKNWVCCGIATDINLYYAWYLIGVMVSYNVMLLWARFDMSVVYHDVISCMRVYFAPGHMYDFVCVVRRYDTDHDTELLFTLPTQLRNLTSAHSSNFVFV